MVFSALFPSHHLFLQPPLPDDDDGYHHILCFADDRLLRLGYRAGQQSDAVLVLLLCKDFRRSFTNLNRQILATRKTVGRYKAEVMAERMKEINPNVEINIHKCFFLPENADDFPFEEYSYIVDAVDTVTAKLEIILRAKAKGVPVISAMGAGNKLDAGRLRVADIYETKVCPLARVMRYELRKKGVKKLKVVYSDEIPTRPIEDMSISCRTHCICPPDAKHKCTERRDIPGSTAFVPAVAGLLIAGEVVRDLAGRI